MGSSYLILRRHPPAPFRRTRSRTRPATMPPPDPPGGFAAITAITKLTRPFGPALRAIPAALHEGHCPRLVANGRCTDWRG